MPTKIITKNSQTTSAAPAVSDLVSGELAVNAVDGTLWVGTGSATGQPSSAVKSINNFPEGIKSTGAGALDYTDAGGWSGTDTAGSFPLRSGNSAFPNKPSGEAIFLLSTGQSNPQGYEPATVQFPVNANVFDYETAVGASGAQSTNPFNFSWRNPNPSETAINDPPLGGLVGYVGYMRGNTGHQAMACANALQVATGRDVYVLSICQGAAGIRWWEAGPLGVVKALLESFVPYVLANTPALANISSPDVLMWGQSETNADPYFTPFDGPQGSAYLPPKDYVTRWQAVQESGYIEDFPTTGWRSKDTLTMLTEPTQKVNWGPRDTPGTEYRWDGMNAVARYTSDATKLVSSMHLPLDANGVGTADVHYSGNGNNQYGERIAKAILGEVTAMSPASQELQRETLPILGGNLNTNGKSLVNGAVTATMPTASGALVTTGMSQAGVFGNRLLGAVTSNNNVWINIAVITITGNSASTQSLTGLATLESFVVNTKVSTCQLMSISLYPFPLLSLVIGTSSAPLGSVGTVSTGIVAPEVRVVANAYGLVVQVRGPTSTVGDIKHRLTYDYNDVSGL
jgi:hypothetical protein